MKRSFRFQLKESSSTLVFFQHVADCLIVVLLLYILTWSYGVSWSRHYIGLSAFSFVGCFISFHAFNLYRSWRGSDYYKELVAIFTAWFAMVGAVLLIIFLTKTSSSFSRAVLVAWFIASPLTIFLTHLLARITLRYARKQGYNIKRAVIVGNGRIMKLVFRHIKDIDWAGIHILGYFEDQDACQAYSGNPCSFLGKIEKLPDFLENNPIDYVYITLPMREEEKIVHIINQCRTLGAAIYLVPDFYTYNLLNTRMEAFGDLLLLNFNPEFRLKRYFDVVFSLIVLLITMPLIFVIALLIKLQDGGPVFYRHIRVTAAGKSFKCIKFRSMCLDAENKLKDILEKDQESKAEWEKTFKLKKDPRITWIGRFLRKTSLDELPQFINVLRGEMSVVGARPIVEKELNHYYKENGGLYCSIKPGITGPWQVSMRSETVNYQDRVELDSWYVLNRSMWLDLIIIFKTVWTMFNGKGAY